MAMSLGQLCKSRSSRLVFPVVFIGLLLLTYILDWWAVRVEMHDQFGNRRFRVVAQINWYHLQSQPVKLDQKQANLQNQDKSLNQIIERISSDSNNINVVNNPNKITVPLKLLPTTKPIKYDENKKTFLENIDVIDDDDNYNDLNLDKSIEKTPNDLQKLVKEHIPAVHVPHINCKALAYGMESEIKKANNYQETHHHTTISDDKYIHLASNCKSFIQNRRYAMQPLSSEEADFPIAYSLLMFKDVGQVERLLRAIYRPQNYYCVHIDNKAPTVIWDAMRAIVKCFDNVFLSSRSVNVEWGSYTVLEPEIICMEDLWKYKWKYFINLTGQEFPLQTNWDIVKILKALNGANNAEGTVKRRNRERTIYVHNGYFSDRKVLKEPAPIHVRLTKGSLHVIVQRGFVDYVLHNKSALAFREWIKDTGVPDETFFTSLNYSPHLGIPGAYKGEPETDKIDERGKMARNPFLARYKNWGTWPFNWPCAGQRVRMVCIFGVGDLRELVKRKELFANKFYVNYHPLAYDCLEELHFNKTRDEVLGLRTFDTTFYENLDCVKNHVI